MTAQVYTKPWDVGRRLAELGLTVDILHDVARAAHLAKASCTSNDPPTFPGTMGWGRATRRLRELVLPEGWRKDDPANFSMTINDERRVYVVVATGDNLTGRPVGGNPQTKTSKGLRTEDAVRTNRQLELFPDAIPESIRMRPETSAYEAWYLLVDCTPERVYVELSCPSEMEGGKISNWRERIIPPSIDIDPCSVEPRPEDFSPDFDVDVKRIA